MIKDVRADGATHGADVTGVRARGCRRPTDCLSHSTGCHENHVPNSTTTTYMTTRPIRRKQPMIKQCRVVKAGGWLSRLMPGFRRAAGLRGGGAGGTRG